MDVFFSGVARVAPEHRSSADRHALHSDDLRRVLKMADASHFYIYVLFRPWNGEPFYVGKGQGGRAYRLRYRSNPHFRAIVDKAGGAVPTVIVRSDLTEVEAFQIECALIGAIGRQVHGGPLVNLTDGGEGAAGSKRSVEQRARRSEWMRGNQNGAGYKHSAETINRLRDVNQNRSASTRAKLSDALTGRKLSPDHCAKIGDNKRGKKLSPEHAAKIGAAHQGQKRSEDARRNISAALKASTKNRGRPLSEEHRAKVSAAMKAYANSPEGKAARSAARRARTKSAGTVHQLLLDL